MTGCRCRELNKVDKATDIDHSVHVSANHQIFFCFCQSHTISIISKYFRNAFLLTKPQIIYSATTKTLAPKANLES
jgi:hypothetical protein